MYETLKTRTRNAVERYAGNERGQDILVWILILAILWLLLSNALTLQ